MTTHISRRLAHGVAVLDVNGPLTADAGDMMSGDLPTAVAQLADTGYAEIALNLRGVTQLDARGLGELVLALRAARDRGLRLRLVAPPPRVERMLSVTRLDTVFELCGSEAELPPAFGSFGSFGRSDRSGEAEASIGSGSLSSTLFA